MLPNRDSYLESIFPLLFQSGYSITSPIDISYNCIGWAAEDKQWWEPDLFYQYYWPPTTPRTNTPESFILAYQSVGYEICPNPDFEEGFEKIAIYVESSTKQVTHAARQLDATTWTSKLGKNYDISHAFEALNGDKYFYPEIFMKRRKQTL